MKQQLPDMSVIGLLRRANKAAASLFEEANKTPITLARFEVLAVLMNHGPINQRILGREAGIDRSTMTQVVSDMKRLGYLTVEQSDMDRRAIFIKITDRGKAVMKIVRPIHAEVEKELTSMIGVDRKTLVSALYAITQTYHD